MTGNPFDQFDAQGATAAPVAGVVPANPQQAAPVAANPFDQFDHVTQPLPGVTGASAAPAPIAAAPLPQIPGHPQVGQNGPFPAIPQQQDPTPPLPAALSGLQPVSDYLYREMEGGVGGAWNKLKGDAQQFYADSTNNGPKTFDDQVRENTAVPRLVGDLGSTILSPVTSLVHAAVIRPAATAIGATQDALGIDTSTRVPGMSEWWGKVGSDGAIGSAAPIPQTSQERQARTEGDLGLALAGLAPGEAPASATAAIAATPEAPALTARASSYLSGLLGKTDPVAVAAHAAGKPVTTAEMLGSPGRVALAATARRPGATGPLVEQVMADRADAAPHVMLDDFQRATGISPEAARGDMEGLAEANRAGKVRPAYDAALANPVTMTPQLASVLQEPEVISALNHAKRLVGTNATEAGFQIDPDTGATVIDPVTQQPVMTTQPTATTLDQAKKFLQRGITRDPITKEPVSSGPGASENVFIQQHLRNLTDALAGNDAAGIAPAIPGYRAALDAAGDTLKTTQAFKLGQQHILNSGVNAADVSGVVADMSPSELEAYQGGQANALFDKAQNGLLTPKKLLTPNVQSKLAASLGQDKASAFADSLRQTKALLDNGRQLAPQAGSQTAPLNAEMARQDAPSGIGGVIGDYVRDFGLGTVAGGSPHMGLHLANLNAGRKAIGAVASKLTDFTMPQAVRDEVGGVLGGTGQAAMTPDQLAEAIKSLKNVKRVPPKVPALTWVGRPEAPSYSMFAPQVLSAASANGQ